MRQQLRAGLVCFVLLMAACGGQEASWEPSYSGAVIGWSVQGRPIVAERFGSSGPVVFLFHAIHGDEHSAVSAGQRMRSWLLGHPEAFEQLQVLFISQTNPDGIVAATRANANGFDLNRNFPASNFEASEKFGPSAASEPETKVIVSLVEGAAPEAIVSVHSPLGVINFDGPAKELAELAAETTEIPIDQDVGIYPGSFGSYAGVDLAIPTVTLELPSQVSTIADYGKWIEAEAAALSWVKGLAASEEVALSSVVEHTEDQQLYEAVDLGKLGDSLLVAEQLGDQGSPVLVVAGLDQGDMGLFAVEHFRSQLLGKLHQERSQRSVLLVLVNGKDSTAESAILQLAEERGVSAVVEVTSTSKPQINVATAGDTDAMLAAMKDALAGPYEPSDEPAGSLAGWADSQHLPALLIEVPEAPANLAGFRAMNVAGAIDAVVAAAP